MRRGKVIRENQSFHNTLFCIWFSYNLIGCMKSVRDENWNGEMRGTETPLPPMRMMIWSGSCSGFA